MAAGVPIVSEQWVDDCVDSGKLSTNISSTHILSGGAGAPAGKAAGKGTIFADANTCLVSVFCWLTRFDALSMTLTHSQACR